MGSGLMTSVLASVQDHAATMPFGQYVVAVLVSLVELAVYFTLVAVVWFAALARWQRRRRVFRVGSDRQSGTPSHLGTWR